MHIKSPALTTILIVLTALSTTAILYGQESYEVYRDRRLQQEQRERPLADADVADRETLYDDLRGAVRDEIDRTIDEEEKRSGGEFNREKLIEDVQKIVREEIEDAIDLKKKRYLSPGTFEMGGFFAMQTRGLESSEQDNNFLVKVYPMMGYFLTSNIAFTVKGEAEFNLTSNSQNYNVGAGPMFVFGLDRDEEVCLYASITFGVSNQTALSDGFGYRYGNDIGLKIILTRGVILNVGTMIAFDTAGDEVTGFQNIIAPTIGITAFF